MTRSSWTPLLCLYLVAPCVALEFVLPATQTVYDLDGPDYWGWSPRPTGVRNSFDLFKRDAPPALCGYVSGILANSLACSPGQYCGWLNDEDAVGCCSEYYTADNGIVSLTGCFYSTLCYDSTAGSAACGTDTQCAYCGDATSPYCFEISFTDTPAVSYGCTDTPNLLFEAAITYNDEIGGGSITPTSSSSPSSSSSTSTTSSSYVTTSSSITTPTYSSAYSYSASSNGQLSSAASASTAAASAASSVPVGPTSYVSASTGVTLLSPPTGGNTGLSTSTRIAATSTGTGAFASGSSPAPTASSSSSSHTGAIVGGVVGGVVGLAILAGLLFFCLRRRRRDDEAPPATTPTYAVPYSPEPHSIEPSSTPTSPPMTQAPYSPVSSPSGDGYQYSRLHPHPGASELPAQAFDGGRGYGYPAGQWSANTGYRGY